MTRDFKNALESFAFDTAAGRAIRHLHDIGMTPEEIAEKLDFPVPVARIEKEIVAYEEEKVKGDGETYTYERVYGKYGCTYFKRTIKKSGEKSPDQLS